MAGGGWRRGAAALLVAAAMLAGCAQDPHPDVSDDVLACASATETGRLIGRGQLGPPGASEDERAAALVREIATLQFALSPLSPEQEAVADAAGVVMVTSDPADAVDATVRLSAICERVEVPIELDDAEHTTAACTQLRGVADRLDGEASAADDQGRADGDAAALARLRFTAHYAEARVDELDEPLGELVEALATAAGTDDVGAAGRALDAALQRCDRLQRES